MGKRIARLAQRDQAERRRPLVGRGFVGCGRLGWPLPADEHERPDWLVFGAVVRLVSREGEGSDPPSALLAEEGFGEIGLECLVEGFARHLMVVVDRWREGDFAAIAESYLRRLRLERGARHAIDASGNLQIERVGEPVVSLDLAAALTAPTWLVRCRGHSP